MIRIKKRDFEDVWVTGLPTDEDRAVAVDFLTFRQNVILEIHPHSRPLSVRDAPFERDRFYERVAASNPRRAMQLRHVVRYPKLIFVSLDAAASPNCLCMDALAMAILAHRRKHDRCRESGKSRLLRHRRGNARWD